MCGVSGLNVCMCGYYKAYGNGTPEFFSGYFYECILLKLLYITIIRGHNVVYTRNKRNNITIKFNVFSLIECAHIQIKIDVRALLNFINSGNQIMYL